MVHMSDPQAFVRALCRYLIQQALPQVAKSFRRGLTSAARALGYVPRTSAFAHNFLRQLRQSLLRAAAALTLFSKTHWSRLTSRLVANYVARRATPRLSSDVERGATSAAAPVQPRSTSVRLQIFSYRCAAGVARVMATCERAGR